MLRKITDSVTKKIQKQQISSTIANKYIETLNIVLDLLDNDINIQTLINLMLTIKKSNPTLVPFYWDRYILKDILIQNNLSAGKIDISFWRDTDFKGIFINAVNRNKWDDIGIVAIDQLQKIIKDEYSKNNELRHKIDKILKNGMDINKLVVLYNNM